MKRVLEIAVMSATYFFIIHEVYSETGITTALVLAFLWVQSLRNVVRAGELKEILGVTSETMLKMWEYIKYDK